MHPPPRPAPPVSVRAAGPVPASRSSHPAATRTTSRLKPADKLPHRIGDHHRGCQGLEDTPAAFVRRFLAGAALGQHPPIGLHVHRLSPPLSARIAPCPDRPASRRRLLPGRTACHMAAPPGTSGKRLRAASDQRSVRLARGTNFSVLARSGGAIAKLEGNAATVAAAWRRLGDSGGRAPLSLLIFASGIVSRSAHMENGSCGGLPLTGRYPVGLIRRGSSMFSNRSRRE
jgi:hypothetical protein